MKIAAIDIGTNSTRLLISEFKNSIFHTLEREMKINRIGKNLKISGKISYDSAQAVSDTLKKYKALLESRGVTRYRAVGTNAVRKAMNSQWFISYIKESTGIKIGSITGEEEAHLTFYGASRSLDIPKSILVVDIGGGSTEFILGSNGNSLEINMAESLDIGCVNLSEEFIKDEGPDKIELEKMYSYICNYISGTIDLIGRRSDIAIIGVAGTVTTLAAIDLELEEYDSSRIHLHRLTREKISVIYRRLCSTPLNERKKIRGLEPGRADIIIGGSAILLEILRQLDKDSIIVSEQDILDGIIYTLVKF